MDDQQNNNYDLFVNFDLSEQNFCGIKEHENERIVCICTEVHCQLESRLCCAYCNLLHSAHSSKILKLKHFFNQSSLLEQQYMNQNQYRQLNIFEEEQKVEIDDDIDVTISQIEEAFSNFIQELKTLSKKAQFVKQNINFQKIEKLKQKKLSQINSQDVEDIVRVLWSQNSYKKDLKSSFVEEVKLIEESLKVFYLESINNAKKDLENIEKFQLNNHKTAVILGLDNAGKTQILYKLKENQIKEVVQTIGFNVEEITYKNIKLTIWDIGGNINLRYFWKYYYNYDIIIWVVDLSQVERFNESQEAMISYYQQNNENFKNSCLIVLGNKSDLIKENKNQQQQYPLYQLSQILNTDDMAFKKVIYHSCNVYDETSIFDILEIIYFNCL